MGTTSIEPAPTLASGSFDIALQKQNTTQRTQYNITNQQEPLSNDLNLDRHDQPRVPNRHTSNSENEQSTNTATRPKRPHHADGTATNNELAHPAPIHDQCPEKQNDKTTNRVNRHYGCLLRITNHRRQPHKLPSFVQF